MAGGYGTRLRPLTMHSPKPVVEFAHSTVFEIQIDALMKAGVKEIMICVAHQAEIIEKIVEGLHSKYQVKMTLLVQHPSMPPMNALKLAKDKLYIDNPDETFFVCNSDVITEFPFTEMKARMSDPTIELVMCVSKSKTPHLFGVVSCDQEDRVVEFHEKPQIFKGDLVNAGIYLFRNKIADMVIEQDISSILTIFDILMPKKAIKSHQLAHYWMDIGNPRDYLEATKLHLDYLRKNKPEQLEQEDKVRIIGNVMIHPSAEVAPSAVLGPNVVVGPGAKVGAGVRLKDSVLFTGSVVKQSAFLDSTILSWRSTVGRHARIQGLTVIAEDVQIADELFINQAQILPNTSIKENIEKPGVVKLV